jgi:hypothetical protein
MRSYTQGMTDRQLFRHAIATLAYRGGKAIRGAPESFAAFTGAGKPPVEILAHIGDLLGWTLRMSRGSQEWRNSTPQSWDAESRRFFERLAELDRLLASNEVLQAPVEKLFQGPIADALTHVGQIAMMRRMAGSPMRGENYYIAPIEAGSVGPEQAAAAKEF